MNIHTVTLAELGHLYKRGARWLCVSAYQNGQHEKGDVLSWHKSYNAAARAAGPSQYREIKELDDIEPYDGPRLSMTGKTK